MLFGRHCLWEDFLTLRAYNLAQDLTVHARFDDLDLISRTSKGGPGISGLLFDSTVLSPLFAAPSVIVWSGKEMCVAGSSAVCSQAKLIKEKTTAVSTNQESGLFCSSRQNLCSLSSSSPLPTYTL